MAIPIIAKILGKFGTAAKAGATASKASRLAKAAQIAQAASKVADVAKKADTVSKVAKVADVAKTTRPRLSLSMLADNQSSTYPTFKDRAKGFVEGAAQRSKDAKFSEPTKADVSISQPYYPSDTYYEHIQKLKALR